MINILFLWMIVSMILVSAFLQSNENESKIVYFLSCFWGNIFDQTEKNLNDQFYDIEPTLRLHQIAEQEGYDLRLADSSCYQLRDLSRKGPEYPEDFKYIISFEITQFQLDYLSKYPKEKLMAILWEPPTTMSTNYDPQYHVYFSRIYTWRDDLVDNKKYFKIYYPVLRPMNQNLMNFEDKKFCVLVAGNKQSWHPNEIYTERRKIIDFFETHHAEDLDLFGGEWPEHYKTYKGKILGGVDSKVDKIRSYKFAIAYENGKDIPGYITEKIFHCFQAGTVPIYWGASNITSYIPKNCFIAKPDFKSNEELYDFLKKMTKEQYMEYIKNIQKYLESEQAQAFSHDNFVKVMLDAIKISPVIKTQNATEG